MTAEKPAVSPEEEQKALRLSKLFDLRTFIGALFVIFGVVVTFEGLTASPADIAKAAGVNLSLWTGLAMFVVGLFFLAWMFLQPPVIETKKADLGQRPDRGSH